jgi:hypothetical protein
MWVSMGVVYFGACLILAYTLARGERHFNDAASINANMKGTVT